MPERQENGESEPQGLGPNIERVAPGGDAPPGDAASARTHAEEDTPEEHVQLPATREYYLLARGLPNHVLASGRAAATRTHETLTRILNGAQEQDAPLPIMGAHPLVCSKNGAVVGLITVSVREGDQGADPFMFPEIRQALAPFHVYEPRCSAKMTDGGRWPLEGGAPLCRLLYDLRTVYDGRIFVDVEAERLDAMREAHARWPYNGP